MGFIAFPPLQFSDIVSQPSDGYYGRTLIAVFDSSNIFLTNDGYFSNNGMITHIPVILEVYGNTVETNPDGYEAFSFDLPGQSITGDLHFTSFTDVKFRPANKISLVDAYGAVEIKEALPINYLDDGNINDPYVQFTAYGGGLFLFDTT